MSFLFDLPKLERVDQASLLKQSHLPTEEEQVKFRQFLAASLKEKKVLEAQLLPRKVQVAPKQSFYLMPIIRFAFQSQTVLKSEAVEFITNQLATALQTTTVELQLVPTPPAFLLHLPCSTNRYDLYSLLPTFEVSRTASFRVSNQLSPEEEELICRVLQEEIVAALAGAISTTCAVRFRDPVYVIKVSIITKTPRGAKTSLDYFLTQRLRYWLSSQLTAGPTLIGLVHEALVSGTTTPTTSSTTVTSEIPSPPLLTPTPAPIDEPPPPPPPPSISTGQSTSKPPEIKPRQTSPPIASQGKTDPRAELLEAIRQKGREREAKRKAAASSTTPENEMKNNICLRKINTTEGRKLGLYIIRSNPNSKQINMQFFLSGATKK